jgi:ribosomal protein S18 acetylase RimI-like enzyme
MSWRFSLKPDQTKKEESWLDQVTVRHVRKEDLPAMEWNGEYTHFRRVFEDAYRHMQLGHSILWLAELNGVGLIGQVFIQLICDRHELADGRERAYLYSFRVQSQYRSKGLGTLMMNTVEEDLIERGFRIITLNVARDNPKAQQLYVRRGYYVVAPEPGTWSYPDEKGVWHQVEEPAWRMEKQLY